MYVDIKDLRDRFGDQSNALTLEANSFYDDLLTDKGLDGVVSTVLVRAAVANPTGSVNCYGKQIPDGSLIGVLNGSIGATGNRVLGTISFRDANKMSAAYRKGGYLVPREEFTGDREKDAGQYVALVNIEVTQDSLEDVIRYP